MHHILYYLDVTLFIISTLCCLSSRRYVLYYLDFTLFQDGNITFLVTGQHEVMSIVSLDEEAGRV